MVKHSLLRNTIHPAPHKNTLNQPIRKLNDFPVVCIPMSMHQGKACSCIVKKGEAVKVGQVIGEATAPTSAPIHASVSGTVNAVRREVAASGQSVQVVEIESDGQYDLLADLKPPQVANLKDFIAALHDSGLVGLGGVGQPTHHKLQEAAAKKANVLIVNAIECEPYVTINHRQCIENPQQILDGIAKIMRFLAIPKAYIGIEKKRPEAAQALRKAIASLKDSNRQVLDIEIRLLAVDYPHGAERFLIRALTGRVVPVGQNPQDIKVLSLNVNTVHFISHYLSSGVPLVRKQLTLDGSGVKEPCNVDVPIGAPILDVLKAGGGLTVSESEKVKVILGDSMLGMALDRLEVSVIKLCSALLVFNERESAIPQETACIRCARCIYACPMKLVPTTLDKMARHKDIDGLRHYHAMACIECGTCTYVCPAKRYLLPNIKHGKTYIKQEAAKEERPS